MKDLHEAEEFLNTIPYFTKKHPPAHTKALLHALGDPQESFRVIHVAGSNGKGSVCSFLFHILKEAGCKAGLFVSPHLTDIRERFVTANCTASGLCPEGEFLAAFDRVRTQAERMEADGEEYPTYFEFLFAVGMLLFQKAKVRIAVIETGMGGRLDCTNIIKHPLAVVITSISLEHKQYLGDTIGAIAAEKAGIIKAGVPVICDGSDPVAVREIRRRAGMLNAPVYVVPAECLFVRELTENGIEFCLRSIYDRDTAGAAARSGLQVVNGQMAADRMAEEDATADRMAEEDATADRMAKEDATADRTAEEDASAGGAAGGSAAADNAAADDGKTDSGREKDMVYSIPFCARYQVMNAALAVTACRICFPDMDPNIVKAGLWHTRWPGRMQRILPGVWLDGAHNPAGIRAFVAAALDLCRDGEQPALLFSMAEGKDYAQAVRILCDAVVWKRVIVTRIPDERGLDPKILQMEFIKNGQKDVRVIADYDAAFAQIARGRAVLHGDPAGSKPAGKDPAPGKLAGKDPAPGKPAGKEPAAGKPAGKDPVDGPAALKPVKGSDKSEGKVFCAGSLYFAGALLKEAEKYVEF